MPLSPALRERVPFGLRVGVRRAPHVVRDLLRPDVPRAQQITGFEHTAAQRSSPMRRQGTTYAPDTQAAKEHNVRRAADRLDRVVIEPGQEFSWHRTLGPPLRINGFVPGPELHADALSMGGGGGVCQAANLVFWLAATSGMAFTARHRHGLDLFPDSNRTVPFGCGATVFYPHRDLRFRNPFGHAAVLRVTHDQGWLVGELRMRRDPGVRFELVERDHRYERRPDGVWRLNRIVRRRLPDGFEETLVHNAARVTYPVPEQEIQCCR